MIEQTFHANISLIITAKQRKVNLSENENLLSRIAIKQSYFQSISSVDFLIVNTTFYSDKIIVYLSEYSSADLIN